MKIPKIQTQIKVEVDTDFVARTRTKIKPHPDFVLEKKKSKSKLKSSKSRGAPREENYQDIEEDRLKFVCELCDEKIYTSIAFARHSIRHSQDNKYHCHYCTYKSSLPFRIDKHMKFQCKVGKQFSRHAVFPESIQAFEHKDSQTVEVSYCCELCEKEFMFSWLLFTHKRLFHPSMTDDPNTLVCGSCNRSYGTRNGLRKHIYRKHNKLSKVEPLCDVCGKTLADNQTLRFHKRIHTGEKPHVCATCGKSFSKKGHLDEHERRHTPEGQHHMRIHRNGGQRYVCEQCGKEVASKRSLQDHLLMHQGLKPIQCKECGRSFTLRTTLIQHMRTHTGDRPYKCKECDKCFAHKTALTVHTRCHTGERPYSCTLCNSGFITKGALSVHKKRKHGAA